MRGENTQQLAVERRGTAALRDQLIDALKYILRSLLMLISRARRVVILEGRRGHGAGRNAQSRAMITATRAGLSNWRGPVGVSGEVWYVRSGRKYAVLFRTKGTYLATDGSVE